MMFHCDRLSSLSEGGSALSEDLYNGGVVCMDLFNVLKTALCVFSGCVSRVDRGFTNPLYSNWVFDLTTGWILVDRNLGKEAYRLPSPLVAHRSCTRPQFQFIFPIEVGSLGVFSPLFSLRLKVSDSRIAP
jgi:hypothetical protein